jgi:hypothetical protein
VEGGGKEDGYWVGGRMRVRGESGGYGVAPELEAQSGDGRVGGGIRYAG